MFDHIDGIIRASARAKPQWREDLFFAVEFARQLLSQSPAEVTPIVGVLHTSALIFDLVPKLQLFTTCEKGMDINSHKNAFYNAQYQEAILKYVANKYCAKHRCLPIIEPRCVPNNTLFTSTIVSGSSQSSFHPYHFFSDLGTDLRAVITWAGLVLSSAEPHAQ